MIQLSTLAEQYIAQVGGSKFRHADDPAIAKYGYASVRSISVGEKMPIIFRNSFYNHDLNQAESKEIQLKIKKQTIQLLKAFSASRHSGLFFFRDGEPNDSSVMLRPILSTVSCQKKIESSTGHTAIYVHINMYVCM